MSARYELGAEIGRGALGRVVVVSERETGERYAGKILHASHRDDERARGRFVREAELLKGLDHPNVVRVLGVAEIDGEQVLLMELCDGKSLARVLAEDGPLPEPRIVAIGRGIAAGLAAAHRAGLVHRDLKPANVLLLPGDLPKIVDFGMARATSFAGVDRKSFALVGTPDYMAPESIDPLAVDPRSDLYSLGCILYELAAGRPPYSGATAFAVLEAHRRAEVPALPPVSAGLAELVRALLAKSPADRPQSANAVEQALARAVAVGRPRLAAPSAAGACVECGAPLAAGVGVCFECGRAPIVLEPGPMTVVVTGPGGVAHKLDSALRGKLLAWITASPQLGLDAAPLAKAVPRLPFIVASGVSESAARRLCEGLKALGLDAEAAEGGGSALASLRGKAWKLAGRRALVAVGVLAPMMQSLGRAPELFVVVAALPIAFAVQGFRSALAPVARAARVTPPALSPALRGALGRVVDVVPAIEARRHRQGLRAVVQRALALRDAIPDGERARIDADLARVVDLATAAAARVDELERRLAEADLREPSATARRQMLERDAWAARLLDAAAQLDALRARWSAALAEGAAAEVDEALGALRAEVAAFEEVQRL